jgi:hypothetical protein
LVAVEAVTAVLVDKVDATRQAVLRLAYLQAAHKKIMFL